MWMRLTLTIRGNRYSVSLIGFLCWVGFALTVFRDNADILLGQPRWLPVAPTLYFDDPDDHCDESRTDR